MFHSDRSVVSVVQELQDQNNALREEVDALRAALHSAQCASAAPNVPVPVQPAAPSTPVGGSAAASLHADREVLPEAVHKVRAWWGDLQAVCRTAQAHSSSGGAETEAAAAVGGDLKVLFEAYPELLRAMLTDGHVAALCNQQHCPPELRCAASRVTLQGRCGAERVQTETLATRTVCDRLQAPRHSRWERI